MSGFGGDGAATEPLWQINLENAEEVQRKDQHNSAHGDDEIGVGKLCCPNWLTSGRLDDDKDKRQTKKPDKNSRYEGETASENAGPTLTRLLNKTENLERDHRQNARHQVKNETADKPENEETNEFTQRRLLVSRCRFMSN